MERDEEIFFPKYISSEIKINELVVDVGNNKPFVAICQDAFSYLFQLIKLSIHFQSLKVH